MLRGTTVRRSRMRERSGEPCRSPRELRTCGFRPYTREHSKSKRECSVCAQPNAESGAACAVPAAGRPDRGERTGRRGIGNLNAAPQASGSQQNNSQQNNGWRRFGQTAGGSSGSGSAAGRVDRGGFGGGAQQQAVQPRSQQVSPRSNQSSPQQDSRGGWQRFGSPGSGGSTPQQSPSAAPRNEGGGRSYGSSPRGQAQPQGQPQQRQE